MNTKKKCTKCNNEKDKTLFYHQSNQKTGLNPACKECVNLYNKKMEQLYADKWWKPGTRHRNFHLKRKFNITVDEYEELLKKQNKVCGICHKPETRKSGRGKNMIVHLAVDHNHKTGEIRGLLCRSCNQALGSLGDSVDLLKKAIDYLT